MAAALDVPRCTKKQTTRKLFSLHLAKHLWYSILLFMSVHNFQQNEEKQCKKSGNEKTNEKCFFFANKKKLIHEIKSSAALLRNMCRCCVGSDSYNLSKRPNKSVGRMRASPTSTVTWKPSLQHSSSLMQSHRRGTRWKFIHEKMLLNAKIAFFIPINKLFFHQSMNNMKRGEYFIDRNAISTSNVIPKKQEEAPRNEIYETKKVFFVCLRRPRKASVFLSTRHVINKINLIFNSIPPLRLVQIRLA